MSSYTIGETAERSGFSASALRYYEGIGLVTPTARSDGGYRLYDDRALDRLAFIGRAKQLGCTLEEITDLVGIWDGQRCGSVQRRFHELVTAKIRDAQAQVLEVSEFAAQLHAAAERLSAEPIDGPCSADCACVAAGPTGSGLVEAASISLGRKPASVPSDVAIVCTLAPGATAGRVAEWAALLDSSTSRTSINGGMRIDFGDEVDLGELGRLVGAEHDCCSFLSFSLCVDGSGTALEVRAPDLATSMLVGLFGTPT